MKRVIIFLILTVTVCSICYSQKKFIYNEYGEKIYFHEIDSMVIVKYGKSVTENDKLRIARTVNPNHNIKSSQTNREIILIDKKVKSDIEELKEDKSAVYINKSLISDDDGTLQVPTDKVLVKMKPQYMLDKILKVLRVEYEQYKRLGHDDYSYLITLNNGKSIEIANKLYESGYFVYAQPSFTHFQGLLNEFYSNQWGLNNTGQYGGTSGIDIKAVQAWNITKGSNSIKVAVVDQGVDLSHPDLAANLLSGYDATDGALGGVNGACLSYDAHGTACAGIIAAVDNTIGIKGVAPGCKIIPVRVTYSEYSSYYQQYIQIWDDDWKVDAINYAWYNASADIISCSWKSSTVAALTNEINAAITQGRNGKGCVVVFAAGNDNASSVSYPASLSNVIAVGAISPCGQRKSPTSCDTETAWGSNYGTMLDVVAPGVLIPTTDIQGNAGYNPNTPIHTICEGNKITNDYANRNYTVWFNGTSAACPHVSGIAALILSVRPDLTQAQVRQAIESTCTKLSGYSYSTNSNHPNGTWNNQVGHGLVNAYAAVNLVAPKISGPSTVCSTTATFSVTNAPTGYIWGHSSGLTLVSTSGNSATFSKNTGGIPGVSVSIIVGGVTVATKYFDMGTSSITSANVGCLSGYIYGHIPLAVGYFSQGVDEFEWRGTTSYVTIEPYPLGYLDIPGDLVRIILTSSYGSGGVEVRAHNNCGYGDWFWVTAVSSYTCSSYSMSASPNPVSTTLNINITSNDDDNVLQNQSLQSQSQNQTLSAKKTVTAKPVYEIKLFTNTGSQVRQTITTTQTGNIALDVSNLPDGLYILYVHDGTDNPPQTQNIIISH